MVVELFGDQMANLAPLVWAQALSVGLMEFVVALVRSQMRKRMMNPMSLMTLVLEFRARVARRLVPLGVVVDLRDQMPNLDPYVGVVWRRMRHPSGEGRQLACG